MSNIRFSIIMPTYNRAYCINNAIRSLLEQTYHEYELIIVDDCSSDTTEEMIKKQYANYISEGKIKYIKLQEHKGVSFARNQGLLKAQYDWIGYLDTDNVLEREFLETYKSLIEEYPEARCFYTQMQSQQSHKVFGHEFSYQELCVANYIDLGVFVHHKSLYEKLGGFDEKLTRLVDWDLILRYTKGNPPKYFPKITMTYNDDETISRISNVENFKKNFKRVCKKNKIIQPEKEISMKLAVLKFIRLFHLISKEKYNKKRQIELVKASDLFDTKWYLAVNPDVKEKKLGAAKHYVKYGWKEGRNPSPKFDGNQYLSDYPEVAEKGICPLVHYIINGRREGRYYSSISGEISQPQMSDMNWYGKLRYALEYPIRLQEECDRLKAEIKALEQQMK